MQERHIDDYCNVDGIKSFVWFLDRFHSVYSIRRETSTRIYVVWADTYKKADNIQARSFMVSTLGQNWEEMLSWRRCKNGELKNKAR